MYSWIDEYNLFESACSYYHDTLLCSTVTYKILPQKEVFLLFHFSLKIGQIEKVKVIIFQKRRESEFSLVS